MVMKNQGRSSGKQLPPEQELRHFKAVVRSLMIDASKVLANIELLSHGVKLEEQIALLDHYLDYTQRLCESDMQEAVDQKAEQQ
jgi:hypothetical protein